MREIHITQHPKYELRWEFFIVPEISKVILVDWQELDAELIELIKGP